MTEDKSKFSLKYLFLGDPTDPKKDWLKAIGNGWRILVIVLILALVGFTIWKAFFSKTNNQNITIGQGSNVKITQGEQKKKFVLFVEPYVDQSSNRKLGTGVRGGFRIEF